MLSSWFIRFHDAHLKRSYARRHLFCLVAFQVLLGFTYNHYLVGRQVFQTHFNLGEWNRNKVIACNDKFMGYGNQFLWLKDVKLNQQNMAFISSCKTDIPRYWFDRRDEGTPYTKWLANLEVKRQHEGKRDDEMKVIGFTFSLLRVEAHNIYHSICEIYNIFLVQELLEIKWNQINILFMDSRPPSKMDEIWTRLFVNILHKEDVTESHSFDNIIWTPIGYASPIHRHYLHSLPLVSKFHTIFSSSFGIKKTKELTCSSFNYTLILRHDYNSHPERDQGKIHRKLANERAVIQTIKSVIGPKDNLRTVLLEDHSIKEQVEIFANTDVLIGVHGAGMTHILNLPEHAFVLELRPFKLDVVSEFPAYHFRAMSRWRGLKYMYVRTSAQSDDLYTYDVNIPLNDLSHQVQIIKCHIDSQCSSLDMPCLSL